MSASQAVREEDDDGRVRLTLPKTKKKKSKAVADEAEAAPKVDMKVRFPVPSFSGLIDIFSQSPHRSVLLAILCHCRPRPCLRSASSRGLRGYRSPSRRLQTGCASSAGRLGAWSAARCGRANVEHFRQWTPRVCLRSGVSNATGAACAFITEPTCHQQRLAPPVPRPAPGTASSPGAATRRATR